MKNFALSIGPISSSHSMKADGKADEARSGVTGLKSSTCGSPNRVSRSSRRRAPTRIFMAHRYGGSGGIRTLGPQRGATTFPGWPFQPLTHASVVEEERGFEPLGALSSPSRFRDECLQPLGHSSVISQLAGDLVLLLPEQVNDGAADVTRFLLPTFRFGDEALDVRGSLAQALLVRRVHPLEDVVFHAHVTHGGGWGIRTPGSRLRGPPAFKAGAINRSANPPLLPSFALLIFLAALGGLLPLTIRVRLGSVVMVAVDAHRRWTLEAQPHL